MSKNNTFKPVDDFQNDFLEHIEETLKNYEKRIKYLERDRLDQWKSLGDIKNFLNKRTHHPSFPMEIFSKIKSKKK